MCGIIGYAGQEVAAEVLMEGLARLEYRGYDSAGLAVQGDAGIRLCRRAGRVSALAAALTEEPMKPASVGIAHTRWANEDKGCGTSILRKLYSGKLYSLANKVYSFILTHNVLFKSFFQGQQALCFISGYCLYRNSGPRLNYFCNIVKNTKASNTANKP